jgi:hypothetical protein
MNTDPHKSGQAAGTEPVNRDVSFETRDVQTGSIYVYLAVLAVAVVLSYGICVFVLRGTISMAVDEDTPPPPVRAEMGKDYEAMPPEPRLQGLPGHTNDPQEDRREKLEQDTAANEKAVWIDQSAGIAQIPVKDAMKLIVEKGLPGGSAAAAGKKSQ